MALNRSNQIDCEEIPMRNADRFPYDLNYFVIFLVNGDGLTVEFWIAQILDVPKNKGSRKCLLVILF